MKTYVRHGRTLYGPASKLWRGVYEKARLMPVQRYGHMDRKQVRHAGHA